MGYLDNTSVTVDAVLTKLGRERLAQGNLNITKFGLGDDEIDYALYDPSHNLGSAYYGEAIERMPVLEAFTNDTQTLKYRLVSLDKNTQQLPVVSIIETSIVLPTPGQTATVNPITENVTGGNASGYSFTIGNSDIAKLTAIGGTGGTTSTGAPTGLQLQATVNGMSCDITGYQLTQTTTTTLTITGIDTGGSVTIPITVNQDPTLNL